MNFDDAILAHSKWKTRLKNHINGEERLDPANIGKDDQCDLGKWIIGEGKKYATLGAFIDLKAKHKNFHLTAASVASNSRTRSRDEALKLVDPLKSDFGRASTDVINALVALKRVVAK